MAADEPFSGVGHSPLRASRAISSDHATLSVCTYSADPYQWRGRDRRGNRPGDHPIQKGLSTRTDCIADRGLSREPLHGNCAFEYPGDRRPSLVPMGKAAHAGDLDLVDFFVRTTSLVLYLLLAHGDYDYQNARE